MKKEMIILSGIIGGIIALLIPTKKEVKPNPIPTPTPTPNKSEKYNKLMLQSINKKINKLSNTSIKEVKKGEKVVDNKILPAKLKENDKEVINDNEKEIKGGDKE